ncbi:hotdog domain-containing protein [Persephonella sp.]
MEVNTHKKISEDLCGKPLHVKSDSFATVELKTDQIMVADEYGLIHGGFIFSSADYCAMLSVNDPNVVLAKASVKFIKPVSVGTVLIFEGVVVEKDGNRRKVEVISKDDHDNIVFKGDFYCVITEKHVLEK